MRKRLAQWCDNVGQACMRVGCKWFALSVVLEGPQPICHIETHKILERIQREHSHEYLPDGAEIMLAMQLAKCPSLPVSGFCVSRRDVANPDGPRALIYLDQRVGDEIV